ncbi:chorismate pyruvate-lyase family protein [Gaetbulibacter jejuensis]|uniref:Chorismate lyase n=1 Tax=Gaetbulibacter jejuensis TaxID=584607 RepID=A0ABP3UQ26_9FLAO
MHESKNKGLTIDSLFDTLVNTNKSTTKLLEEFTNMVLNVELLEQFPFSIKKGSFLKRQTLLFFYSIQKPVIYSESIINLYRIKVRQKDMLSKGTIAIGRVFRNQVIDKRNITIEKISSNFVKDKLCCNSSEFYFKQYDMFIDDEPIGVIKEFFCNETIQRVNP